MDKEELKNELKNRISLALKDPILQIGFECICKENADLKAYNEKLLNGDIEKHNKIVELEAQIENLEGVKLAQSSALETEYVINKSLKEENATLKAYNEKLLNGDIEKHNKIVELETENAELKEKLKHRNCVDCSNHGSNIKLLKAKAIISEFIKWADWQGNSKCPSFKRIQDKAEQFLKEIEND